MIPYQDSMKLFYTCILEFFIWKVSLLFKVSLKCESVVRFLEFAVKLYS